MEERVGGRLRLGEAPCVVQSSATQYKTRAALAAAESKLVPYLLFLPFNPPTPETFFASDFDDFCKYGSHATLEKGKGRK